jgi:hypothetical protein
MINTYNVVWTEKFSVNVEAESEEKAIEIINKREFKEEEVAGEINTSPIAYLMPKLN